MIDKAPYCPKCERWGEWFRTGLGQAVCTMCATVMLEGLAASHRALSDTKFEYPRYDALVAEAKRNSHQTTPGRMTLTIRN